ncbi:MAG: hypothetical protein ACRYF3_15545 [Janthinobacterium lividum]
MRNMAGYRLILLSGPLALLGSGALAGCSQGNSAITPPHPDHPAATTTSAVTTPGVGPGGDPAVAAVRSYLREQALAINAQLADPAGVPAFTATLTDAGRQWALPLLAANLGDQMPGPYPMGVLSSEQTGDERVELSICLQDRGWQVGRGTGVPVNAAHYTTARAVVVRVAGRWLVDDVVTDGGACSADQVVEERF